MGTPNVYRHWHGPLGTWLFGAGLVALLGVFAWFAAASEAAPRQPASFGHWLAGACVIAAACVAVLTFFKPMTTVVVDGPGVVVTRRWLLGRRTTRHAATDLVPALFVL